MSTIVASWVGGVLAALTSPEIFGEDATEHASASDPANGQPALPPTEPDAEPEAPEDDRQKARGLFLMGNGEFERDRFADAARYYRDALALWEHPAIHFNLAVCLINLDQPVQALAHLRQALERSAETLGGDFRTQAQTYAKLLEGRLARLQIRCVQAGVDVTLDGKHLLRCPATTEQHLIPGEHQIVAEKPGYVPLTRSLDLRAGESTRELVELRPPKASTRLERRWKVWVPLLPLAAGVAVGVIGGALRISAVARARRFDREISDLCPQGCNAADVPETVRDLRGQARSLSGASIGMFVVGGVAVTTGVTMLILNRRREVVRPQHQVSLLVGPREAGVYVRARF